MCVCGGIHTVSHDTFIVHSSANAKKWEVELATLKNNNARLTAALQESTANVEEWKKQLATYKEENARLRKKVNNFKIRVDHIAVLNV
jgi:homer protein